jgi:hypothetical protein
MSVSTNYSTPVTVNGYTCKNCTDVDYAKKHIDPAHPKSGPYGIDAETDPTVKQTASVTFAGALAGMNAGRASQDAANSLLSDSAANTTAGAQLDISA